jgi:hypothetical protein
MSNDKPQPPSLSEEYAAFEREVTATMARIRGIGRGAAPEPSLAKPRKTGAYDAEEEAGLRALTEGHDPSGVTRRLLATLDRERQARLAAEERGRLAGLHAEAVQAGYQRDLDELRAAASALVASLPKCDDCSAPATSAWERGGARWCDDCAPRATPEYPRAAPLRALASLLTPEPTDG